MENLIENQTENLTETLTSSQKETIARRVNHTKFADIAKEVGCSREAVHAYARVVFAEQRARREADQAAWYAAYEARCKAFYAEAERLLKAGNMDALRTLWHEENAADIIGEVLVDNSDARNEIVRDFVEEHEDEIDERFREAFEDEINEALEEGFEEFVEDLKAN